MSTPFASSRTLRPGRPSPIPDVRLFHRRNTLLCTFEYCWAYIGWELRTATSFPEIRKALSAVPTEWHGDIELFLCEQIQPSTPEEINRKRRAVERLSQHRRDTIPELKSAAERLERVRGALQDNPNDPGLIALCRERGNTHTSLSRMLETLNEEIEKISEQLRQHGAYVAQSALLAFISSPRYTLTPLSTANAMAGVPFIAWRTSADRCEKEPASHGYQFRYENFLEIERALGLPLPLTPEEATDRVKAYLLLGRHQKNQAVPELREKWHLLRCAIASTPPDGRNVGSLPYRICAEYQRRSSSLSPRDQVMLEEERL